MLHEKSFDETLASAETDDALSGETEAEKMTTQSDDCSSDLQEAGVQNEAVETCEDASQKEMSPQEKIEELECKLAELNDQYLRKAADFENFRKRIVKEKQEAVEFANQSLLLDLIATLDDFERAINAAASSAKTEAGFDTFREGISIVEKRLLGQLENKWGLKRFESVGMPFDPARHEALFMEKSAGVSEPTVQEDFAKGYMLKDRVVRTAKVKVLMPETEGEN
ncbi:MAG: nucleotide exchange factor GrpE [Treponema sp.]|nr:nucleotide exchange factor GrpE [Treponema sp.]